MLKGIKRSVHNGRTFEYLWIVRSYREGKKVRKQVPTNLSRRKRLPALGPIPGIRPARGHAVYFRHNFIVFNQNRTFHAAKAEKILFLLPGRRPGTPHEGKQCLGEIQGNLLFAACLPT